MDIDQIIGEILPEHAENMDFVVKHMKAVMLAPGCGEQALNHLSIDQMKAALPNLELVGLSVSWFVNNTDIENIEIKPGVEKKLSETDDPWLVSNYDRSNAYKIHRSDVNDPSTVRFGGTMPDDDVLLYAKALKDSGLKVAFYPFLMVDNENKDWRGVISSDAEHVADFSVQYNKFVMHYAELLKDEVDTFYLGSELKGATSIKDDNYEFPFVTNLINLAADIRQILGTTASISYAANWDEYHSCAGGFRPLDLLWSNQNINFVGINYYMPLTNSYSSNITIDQIKAGFKYGEGIDYFYVESNKIMPFTNQANQLKNLAHWHSTDHWGWNPVTCESYQTSWIPESKPIIFSEFGFRSINNCTNQPNVYGDKLPKHSDGSLDFPLQMRAIRAILEYIKETNFIKEGVCYCWDSRGYGWQIKYVDGKYWQSGHWIDGKIAKKIKDDSKNT